MNDLLEQTIPRADVILALRSLAARGTTVRELVREIHTRLGLADDVLLPVLWYFTQAFGVTLPDVLPIREWIGSDKDQEIDAEIMPAIERTKAKWFALDGMRST
jgi:hypothetical protein